MHAILCAVPQELEALRQQFHVEDQPRRHGAAQVWVGVHDGRPIALALAGIGKVNAAAGAAVLLDRYEAKALIFSGVAGGLNPAFGVGSVLLGERLAIHDFGLVAEGAFIPTASGEIPIGAPRLQAAELVSEEVRAVLAQLRDAVAPRLDASVALGSLITADYFLNCAVTRDGLHATLGADAIDMESGAVAQVAKAWGAPLYVIRTLSDQAGDDSHLSFTQMAAMAARNSAVCVAALLEILA
ncbi:5'-methylthioadenosine/S-adenosylhomocysteine nucleosidase [Caulobacter sp. NIBR2454]|uniref:5'-methylthioadenosine/S-adenosylhomocysteine nucleosidase n=1 Tax=Caulobacter sp. NIBR2454 TaxID=3015996 RepID=UPI0022B607BC|nr:5'-methylthioadenosine/S-adenosylhomocysteine nucleosidase [Caulobacter sp. NIBR2454]